MVNSSIDGLQIVMKHVATRSKAELTGFYTQLPNPDKILKDHNLKIDSLYNMLYDSHIASVVQSRKSGVMALEWGIKKRNSSDFITNFITNIFAERMEVRKIIDQMTSTPLWGYLPVEIYWTLRFDNMLDRMIITPYKLEAKPPHWFDFDTYNRLRFLNKENNIDEIVNMKRFLLLQHEASYNDPYGTALLSKCFWAFTFKTGTIKLWVKFLEKYGMPWAVGTLPSNAPEGSKDTMLEDLDDLKQDAVAAIQTDTSITLVEGNKGSSTMTYESLAHFCNAEISKAILSQTLTTEQGDTGSYAMSQTHLQVRKDVVDADAEMISEAMNRLIRLILDYNFLDVTEAPEFVMKEKEDVDMVQADRDVKLASSGQFKFTKKYWMDEYGFAEDDIELIEQQTAPGFSEPKWLGASPIRVRKFGIFTFKENVASKPPQTADEWKSISWMSFKEMKSRGMGNWNGKLFLIPQEWLSQIPADIILIDIFGAQETGAVAKHDDESRFGYLAYGFEAWDGVEEKEFAEVMKELEDSTEVLEELTEFATTKMSTEFQTMLQPVLNAIKGSRNYAHAKDKILKAYPNLDSSKIKNLLHTSLILGDFAGRTTASEV